MSFLLADRGVAGCQWLLEGYVQCGLLAGHDGEHVPFVPGDYLPPPMLHPLDMWGFLPAWRCPLCTEYFDPNSTGAEAVTPFRGGMECQWTVENWDRVQPEWQWEFWPCSCAGRSFDLWPCPGSSAP